MYRLPLPLHDPVFDLRRQVLNQVLLATAVASGVYLLAGLTPWVGSALYPWEGLGMLALAGVCYGLTAAIRKMSEQLTTGSEIKTTIHVEGTVIPYLATSRRICCASARKR